MHKLNFLGFNNGISSHAAPSNQLNNSSSAAFVSESNFSSVFGNTEAVGM